MRALTWRLALLGLTVVGAGAEQSEQQLEMDTLRSAFVNEDSFQHYSVLIPSKSNAIKVKLIPSYGDPDVYLSFTAPEPDDLTATWVMDDVGAEEQVIKRDAVEFCQSDPCILHISVYGYDESEYMIGIYDASSTTLKIESECAPGCKQDMIADGTCQQACKVSACYDDGGDCEEQNCAPGCDEGWVGDEYCDEACFVEACNWDGGDCSENSGCSAGCLPEYINDGECDSECNVAACGFDGDDCFHGATECYGEADGRDYRGSVSRTKSGKVCQKWDAQFPQQHTRTHLNYPGAGLGGHNHCRNPDGSAGPWCYTTDASVRYELCDVGQPWQHCTEQNEIPLVKQQAGAVQCINRVGAGRPPSGPLPRFEAACGNGESHADVCSRKCCNAAKVAALYCVNNGINDGGRYQSYKSKIAASMLKQGCNICNASADTAALLMRQEAQQSVVLADSSADSTCASHELPGGGPLLRFEALCITEDRAADTGRDKPAELVCTSACCESARAARIACLGASGELASRFERAFMRAAFGALRANCTRGYCNVFAAFLDEGHPPAAPCVGSCGQHTSTGIIVAITIVLTISLWTAVLMAWSTRRRLLRLAPYDKQFPSIELPFNSDRDALLANANDAPISQLDDGNVANVPAAPYQDAGRGHATDDGVQVAPNMEQGSRTSDGEEHSTCDNTSGSPRLEERAPG